MDILENPFYILTATPYDNRNRITELADERSLMLDSDKCMNARSDLTNPRKRLSSEVAWLLGVSQKRSSEILLILIKSPADVININNLTSVARANLLVAGLARLPNYTSKNVARWILEIAQVFEDIDLEELRLIINDERTQSGFPDVTDISILEDQIQALRLYYRHIFKSVLNKLSAKKLIDAVTITVESATANGEKYSSDLIADIVDFYEVEAQDFLEKEEKNIKSLSEKLQTAIDSRYSDATLAPIINQLINVVRKWDIVAQPIQVNAKSRGLEHAASHRVAGLVRKLAVHMFNQHEKLDFSLQLTHMLQEVFAEVGEVAELTAQDAKMLSEIAEKNKSSDLLEAISHFCNVAINTSEKHPASADKEAQKVMNSAPQLIRNLLASNVSSEVFSQGKDELALTLMCCSIIFGNNTKKWSICIPFLEKGMQYATNQEVKDRIQKNLEIAKANEKLHSRLAPISSASPLHTVNSIGMELWSIAIIIGLIFWFFNHG